MAQYEREDEVVVLADNFLKNGEKAIQVIIGGATYWLDKQHVTCIKLRSSQTFRVYMPYWLCAKLKLDNHIRGGQKWRENTTQHNRP